MFDILKQIFMVIAIALGCAGLAYLLNASITKIKTAINTFVREVEEKVQGSGLGEEKKAKVIAQLKTCGIWVNKWVEKMIDKAVAILNEQSAWLINETKDDIEDVKQEIIDSVTTAVTTAIETAKEKVSDVVE